MKPTDSPFGLPSAARRRTLLERWGFACACELCTAPAAELAASDARRDKIAALGREVVQTLDRLGSGSNSSGGDDNNDKAGTRTRTRTKTRTEAEARRAVALYHEVVDAVRDEGLVPHLGAHYEVLARLYAAAGDVREAVEWLRRAEREVSGFKGG